MVTSGKLQDIEAWIEIVYAEKYRGKLYYWINRLGTVPFMWNKSTDQWLELLEFERKKEIAKLKFRDKLHKQYLARR